MPLIIDEGRMPPRWAAKKRSHQTKSVDRREKCSGCLRLALINNMPDAALEDTELQFFQLLDTAAGPISVCIELYSLPKLPRSDRTQNHLSNFYFDFGNLWNKHFDGVIVTGTEPRQPNLRHEPYWPALVDVLDWAEHNTTSTVLSCLAAHAGVLYSDGVDRRLLSDKQFGVFTYERVRGHALMADTPDSIQIPHSRWNEVSADELTSSGYVVLTQSAEAGVDLFMKEKGRSLFVHFQGHPEYESQTLLKEYRRDIKRFLKGERETFPSMPKGYFDLAATKLLTDFREIAESDRREEVMAKFPDAVCDTLQNLWHASAARIYRNWLKYMLSKTADTSEFPSAVSVLGNVQRNDLYRRRKKEGKRLGPIRARRLERKEQ